MPFFFPSLYLQTLRKRILPFASGGWQLRERNASQGVEGAPWRLRGHEMPGYGSFIFLTLIRPPHRDLQALIG